MPGQTADNVATASRTISKNALALFASQAATWAVSAIMLAIVPGYLGDRDFGRFSFAITYIGAFGLVGALGTSTYLIKATAREPSNVGVLTVNALSMKAVLGAGLSIFALCLGIALGYDTSMLLLLFAASISMTLGLLNDVVTAALQGLERMTGPAAWTVAQQYLAAGLGLLVVALDGGVVAYAFALTPAALIPIVANIAALHPYMVGRTKPDFHICKQVVLGGMPYLAWSAVLLIYGSVDIFMLKPMAGEATVGWYALAYKWVAIPTGMAATVLIALLPSLSAAGPNLGDDFSRRANRALRLAAFALLPASAGIALVAGDLLWLLYADEFVQAIPLLRILAISIPFVVVDMLLGMVLIAADRQRQWVVVGCIAAVLNPALNVLAIPLAQKWYGNAAIGAAAVTLLTEIIMMFGAIHLRPRQVLDPHTVRYILRCTFAVAVMAAAVTAVGETHLVLKATVGVFVYSGASWASKTIPLEDIAAIFAQFTERRASS